MRALSRCASSRKLWLTSAVGALAALSLAGTAFTAEAPNKDEVFKLTTAIQADTTALVSFDISWGDSTLHRYFLADRSHKSVDVINPADNSITVFPNPLYAGVNAKGNDFSGPDGLLTANNHTEVWVGDSPGKVWVQDSTTLAVKTLPGGAANPIFVGGTSRADELCYAPKANVIMIASPVENYVSFISTKTYKVLSQLTFNGSSGPQASVIAGVPLNGAGINGTNGIEQCQFSEETGKFYQNIPEVNGPGDDTKPGLVAVIDPTTMKVETTFPIPLEACAGPQGMTIGPHNQILLGCGAPSPNGHSNLAIINQHSGAVLASIPDLGGDDEVWFNDSDGHYFIPSCNAACRAKPGSQIEQLGVVDANGFRLDHSVPIASPAGTTGRRIHSVAADSNTNQVYVPIPAIAVTTPPFPTSVCSSAPNNVGSPTDATGCIAVFTTKHDDRSRIAHEREKDERQD